MTPEREDELARQLGLEKPPPLRYDDAPVANKETAPAARPSFLKALQLVDQIETWAFERFIPDFIEIDQNIDAHVQGPPELHFAVCIRTDVPPPSNLVVWKATGVKPPGHPDAMSPGNFYQWLAIEVANQYRELGAKRMGVPLIFRTKGSRKEQIVPFVGAICKYDRTPPDGMTMESMMADVGVMIPTGTVVDPTHIVTPLNPTPTEET